MVTGGSAGGSARSGTERVVAVLLVRRDWEGREVEEGVEEGTFMGPCRGWPRMRPARDSWALMLALYASTFFLSWEMKGT